MKEIHVYECSRHKIRRPKEEFAIHNAKFELATNKTKNSISRSI